MKRSRHDEQPPPHPLDENSDQDLTTAESPVYSNAMNYIKEVADTFHKESIEYQEFLELMRVLKSQSIEIPRLIARIKELFKGHRDLILGFNTFLPPSYQISLPPEDELHAGGRKPVGGCDVADFVTKVKHIFQGGHVYERFTQWLSLYAHGKKPFEVVHHEIAALFSSHPDLQLEFTRFLPHRPPDASMRNAQSAKYPTLPSHDKGFPVKTGISENPHRKQIKEENEIMEDRDDKTSEHICVDVDHGLQFDSQIEKTSGREDSVTDHSSEGIHWQELALSHEDKEILKKSDDYQELNKCLLNYKSSRFPDPHFQMLLRNMLKDHPDLGEKFKDYFDKRGLLCAKKENICRPVKTVDCDADQEFGREAGDIDGKDTKKEDACGREVASDCKDELGDQNLIKHTLGLHDFHRCTPSYRLLPKDYPIPKASHRTEDDSKVLNDHLVAVTSGSEDRSFKYMRKNQYEYNLFRCEDDRFEVDMLLQTVKAAISHVEQLIKKIDKQRGPIPLEDHLTALDFRCIERLYGDHGLEVMDALHSRPSLALPIILNRLKQKEDEWARTQSDFNVIWAETYAKNYHKSLDYQGFNFKQQDMKSLSTKALLAEIREIADMKSREDDVLRFSLNGVKCHAIPHLEFEVPDPDIHDDLYQLVKYYCQQTYTPKHSEKLMNIWTTYLEPMLGVPSRLDCSEDAEDDLNAKDSIDKCVHNEERHGSCSGSDIKQPIPSGRGDQTPNPENSTSRNDSYGIQVGGFSDTGATSAVGVLPTSIEQISNSIDGSKENLGLNVENIPEFSSPARAPGNTSPDLVSKMTTSNVLKVSRCKRLFLSSSGPTPKGLKIQIPQQASVEEPETEGEEGGSPDQDYQEFDFPAWGDTFEETARSTKDTAGSSQHQMRTRGNGNCGGAAEEEDDTSAHFEGEENTKGLSHDNNADANNEGEESESAFKNGGVSGSESAYGKKGSFKEPDEDGNEDVNDKNCESEREAEETSDGQDDESNGILTFKKYFLQTATPLTKWAPPSHERESASRLFYGNDSFYLLFRLHNKLYERLQKAKLYSSSSGNMGRTGNDTGSMDLYARFMDAVYNLLDGSFDNEKFEHSCHTIIGRDSYMLFTLDKLIHRIVKQLHSITTQEINTTLIQLHSYETSRKAGTFMDSCYHANARVLLPNKDIFRIEYMPAAARLSIQLVNSCFDKADATPFSVDPDFAAYVTDLLDGIPEKRERQRIFLRR